MYAYKDHLNGKSSHVKLYHFSGGFHKILGTEFAMLTKEVFALSKLPAIMFRRILAAN